MSDARPALAPIFDTLGVPATITPPGGSPAAATVVWLVSSTAYPDAASGRAEMTVQEVRRHLLVRKDEVGGALPTATIIDAPPRSGAASEPWRVEAVESEDDEVFMAVVM